MANAPPAPNDPNLTEEELQAEVLGPNLEKLERIEQINKIVNILKDPDASFLDAFWRIKRDLNISAEKKPEFEKRSV